MTTDSISIAELRQEVTAVLSSHGLTLQEFLKSDIDSLPTTELRDLWLMVREVLLTSV